MLKLEEREGELVGFSNCFFFFQLRSWRKVLKIKAKIKLRAVKRANGTIQQLQRANRHLGASLVQSGFKKIKYNTHFSYGVCGGGKKDRLKDISVI